MVENVRKYLDDISKNNINLQGGLTPSGNPHIGTFRERILLSFLYLAAKEEKLNIKINFLIDDHDSSKIKKYKNSPLFLIKYGKKTYSEHYLDKIISIFKIFEIESFFKISKMSQQDFSEYYSLINSKIPELYSSLTRITQRKLEKNFNYFMPLCKICNKIKVDSRVIELNSEKVVFYCCEDKEQVHYHKEGFSGKLRYKFEWPIKWHKFNTDLERSGKDHSYGGGSQIVAKEFSRILGFIRRRDLRYEFVSINGKIPHKSKGQIIRVKKIIKIFGITLIKFIYLTTPREKSIDFETSLKGVSELNDRFYKELKNINLTFLGLPEEIRKEISKVSFRELMIWAPFFNRKINALCKFLGIVTNKKILKFMREKVESILYFIRKKIKKIEAFEVKTKKEIIPKLFEKYNSYLNINEKLFGNKQARNLKKYLESMSLKSFKTTHFL